MGRFLIHVVFILSVFFVSLVSAQTNSMVIEKSTLPILTTQDGFIEKTNADAKQLIKPKIVGGTTAVPGKYPEFTVIFELREATADRPAGYFAICGGTLIAEEKVLTAAHCVEDKAANSIYVVPGFYSIYPYPPENVPLMLGDFIPLSRIDIHPRYSLNTITSVAKIDAAVLTMAKKTDVPLALLYGGSEQFVNQKGTVIGIGTLGENSQTAVPTLREVNVPIVSNAVCSRAYSEFPNAIAPEMLCAGIAKGGQGTCLGDSGGPLWTNHKGRRIQVGIVSFSKGCARAGKYGVYARISELIDFIREHASVITMIDAIPAPAIINLLLSD